MVGGISAGQESGLHLLGFFIEMYLFNLHLLGPLKEGLLKSRSY